MTMWSSCGLNLEALVLFYDVGLGKDVMVRMDLSDVGLDPRTMRLYPFFPNLLKLKQHVTALVKKEPAW